MLIIIDRWSSIRVHEANVNDDGGEDAIHREMGAQAQITLVHRRRELLLLRQPQHRRISTIHPWDVFERDGDDSKRDVGNSIGQRFTNTIHGFSRE